MAVIAQYNLGAATVTSKDANVTAGNLTNGSLSAFSVNQSWGYASDPTGMANPASGATSAANAITYNSYFYFVITPGGGYVLNLTSLTFTAARGGAATPRGYDVRTSVDAYAATVGAADLATQRTTWTNVSIDLSGAGYQGLSSALTIRIYIYCPATSNSVEYDTIVLNGTVTASGISIPVAMAQYRQRRA